MNARIKKEGLMLLVTIPITSLAFFVLVMVLRNIGKEPSFLASINDRTVKIGIIASITACIPIPFLVKAIFKVNDELSYDDLGMSKKNRHFMRSDLRESIEAEKIAKLEKIIPSEELRRITKKGSENPDEDLKRLVGLGNIKERVEEMKARIEFDRKERKSKKSFLDDGYHAVYFGAPGTGKTELARIVTGILYDNYYINENKIVETDGNFLVGKNEEETAIKIKVLTKAAYGGVLFVDEAYQLAYSSLGVCAIASLIKEMEDNRDKFVVIFAGYKNLMQDLLHANPGFSSRIKEFWEFKDYTGEELWDIFKLMAKNKEYMVDESVYPKFLRRIEKEQCLDTYGNARTIRRILSETLDHHAVNFTKLNLPKDKRHVLVSEDLDEELSSNFYGV